MKYTDFLENLQNDNSVILNNKKIPVFGLKINDTKKINELLVSVNFLNSLSLDINEITLTEKPDVILTTQNSRNISIELVEFFNDFQLNKESILKKKESFLNSTRENLNEFIHNYFSDEKFHITITTNEKVYKEYPFGVNQIKSRLKEMVESREFKSVNPIEGISQILLEKSNQNTLMFFRVTDYNEIKVETINNYITHKTILQSKWEKNFSENWLLIYTGYGSSNNHRLPFHSFEGLNNISKIWDKVILFFPIQDNRYIDLKDYCSSS